MPKSDRTERVPHPLGREGVTILSAGPEPIGVKTYSKVDGEAPPGTNVETKIVDNVEFDKAKKLVEDEA
jgi:hypothetical protein